MNNKIKGLILETVSEVLLEGRLEDVKSKYPEENAGDIDRLSQGDPSGNNKYLAWMANQLITVGEHNHEYIIDIVKRFHKEQARINPTMSKEVVEANSELYPGRESRRVSNNPKDINSYSTIEGVEKVIEVAEENVPSSTERDKIYQDDNWTVIVPKTHQASCKYGVHSAWCVSTSNERWYNNYTENGMLAFVLWRNRQEGQMDMQREGDYKVAAYIKYDRPEYKNWQWFNKKDTQMDNDLLITIFPPALLQAIQNHVKGHMKASGYLVDVDEQEIEEKSHLLQVKGNEGERRFLFIPKVDVGVDWVLDKYDRRNQYGYHRNPDYTQVIPFYRLSEPRGDLSIETLDLTGLFRRLQQNKKRVDDLNAGRRSYGRIYGPMEAFKQSMPYSFRNLSDQKFQEVFDFVKNHFQENYKGFMGISTTDLQVGDYVRWERKTRRDRNRLGRYRQGEIVRQTPSGFFVVNVVGEDKPARFKPDYGKYMDKRYEPENLDMSVWDYEVPANQ
jgi:hypothetical protein